MPYPFDTMLQVLREEAPELLATPSVEEAAPARGVSTAQLSSKLAKQMAGLRPSERHGHAETLVLRTVKVLTDEDAVTDANTPLMDAGIDSLAATELTSRLSAETELTLPSTLLFEIPHRALLLHTCSS